MNTRLLVFFALSGALHAGLFAAAPYWERDLLGGQRTLDRARTVTVSVELDPAEGPVTGKRHPRFEDAPETRGKPEANTSRAQPARQGAPPVPLRAGQSSHRIIASPGEHYAPASKTRIGDRDSVRTQGGKPPGNTLATLVPDRPVTIAAASPGKVSPPASSSPAAPPASRDREDRLGPAERTYLAGFLAALAKHKYYPRSARERSQQGEVVVALVLRNDGSITEIEVEQASRYPSLNHAALRSVKRLHRFKPFPADIDKLTWHLSVPFKYSIRGR